MVPHLWVPSLKRLDGDVAGKCHQSDNTAPHALSRAHALGVRYCARVDLGWHGTHRSPDADRLVDVSSDLRVHLVKMATVQLSIVSWEGKTPRDSGRNAASPSRVKSRHKSHRAEMIARSEA